MTVFYEKAYTYRLNKTQKIKPMRKNIWMCFHITFTSLQQNREYRQY